MAYWNLISNAAITDGAKYFCSVKRFKRTSMVLAGSLPKGQIRHEREHNMNIITLFLSCHIYIDVRGIEYK